jgi:hypothetical protein
MSKKVNEKASHLEKDVKHFSLACRHSPRNSAGQVTGWLRFFSGSQAESTPAPAPVSPAGASGKIRYPLSQRKENEKCYESFPRTFF